MRLKEHAKKGVDARLDSLSVEALLVLCDVVLWCRSKQLRCVISDAVSTKAEDDKLQRVSSTHREGRAFDLSTRGWARETIDECIRVFGFKYRHIAAVAQDGSPRLVYFHNAGTGEHLHFQVHSRYALPPVDFD